ncbi:MAG TPA: glycosyltransferase [Candidatus Methylomirabilis sp.]|nr:glycosyltransferase [Candidatus Methylomirabilis sp.]
MPGPPDTLRLALATPHYFPSVRGKSVTVQRIESGPRDQGVAARVDAVLRDPPWGVSLDTLTHDEVCAILPQVEVVVNSSLSEGGMSSAVLEAVSKGVPVLASDIQGNRSVVVNGPDGFLSGSEAEFVERVEPLVDDPALRYAPGRRAARKLATELPQEGRIARHLALYRSLVVVEGG